MMEPTTFESLYTSYIQDVFRYSMWAREPGGRRGNCGGNVSPGMDERSFAGAVRGKDSDPEAKTQSRELWSSLEQLEDNYRERYWVAGRQLGKAGL